MTMFIEHKILRLQTHRLAHFYDSVRYYKDMQDFRQQRLSRK